MRKRRMDFSKFLSKCNDIRFSKIFGVFSSWAYYSHALSSLFFRLGFKDEFLYWFSMD